MPIDHNLSAVVLPDGIGRNEMKVQVQLCVQLTERERTLLFFVLDQAESWIITVGHIRSRMQWGEDRWRTVRNGLEGKGVLTQEKIRKGNNSHCWRLGFDFVVVMDLFNRQLSTDSARTPVSRARARSQAIAGDHVIQPTGQGSREPTHGARVVTLRNLKKPPQEVAVPMLIKKMGLSTAQAERVARAAHGATEKQLEDLLSAWQAATARPQPVGAGLAVYLARLAAAGQLEQTGSAECSAAGESVRQACERIGKGCEGYIVTGPSLLRPLKAGPFGRLQADCGGVLDDAGALRVWLQVESGELDCRLSHRSLDQVSIN